MKMSVHAHIPDNAGGLVAALDDAMTGNPTRLKAWMRDVVPLLEDAVRRMGASPADAEEAVLGVVEAAWCVRCAGVTIRSERPWMARVLANSLIDQERGRSRYFTQLILADPLSYSDPVLECMRSEERVRIRSLAQKLPPPYREVMILQGLHGSTRRVSR